MSPAALLLASLLLPALGAIAILLAGRWPNLREAVTLTTAVALFGIIVMLVPAFYTGQAVGVTLGAITPSLSIALAVEPLGLLFALVAALLWVVNSIYSIGYMRGNEEAHQTRFYVCFAIAIASAQGAAFAANLFTLFVFYELLTFSTYALVAHKGTPEAMQGARTYMVVLVLTSVTFLLGAILWTMAIAGTGDFTPGGILEGRIEGWPLLALAALFAFGISKSALMPFHRWLPAAMVAPTPVSALLHAVAVVKVGVFSVLKVAVYVFGLELYGAGAEWLIYLAGFTVVAASLVALRQDDLKRRLAYSTISQLSYIVMAAAIATPAAIIGGALHIAAHAFGKITLFFAAGSIYTAAHKTKVSELDGIGRRMPWTMAAFFIGSLSMVGVPMTAGFISKWYIFLGAYQAERWFPLIVLAVSTLLTAAYLLSIVHRAFFRDEKPHGGGAPDDEHGHGEAPWPMVVAITATAALTVLMFLMPDLPLGLAELLAGSAR
jgi:multicomponent Na+:H+ antiporter subunit D